MWLCSSDSCPPMPPRTLEAAPGSSLLAKQAAVPSGVAVRGHLPDNTAYLYCGDGAASAFPVRRVPEPNSLQELLLQVLGKLAVQLPSCGHQIRVAGPGGLRTLSAILQRSLRTLQDRGASPAEAGQLLCVLCPCVVPWQHASVARMRACMHARARAHSVVCPCCALQATTAARLRVHVLALLCRILDDAEHAAERAAQLCAEGDMLRAVLDAAAAGWTADPRRAGTSLLGLRALCLIMG